MSDLTPTFQGLLSDVDGHLASGSIDNGGVANSLKKKLFAAEAAIARGNSTGAIKHGEFIDQVSGEIDGHIASQTADRLITAARALIAGLS